MCDKRIIVSKIDNFFKNSKLILTEAPNFGFTEYNPDICKLRLTRKKEQNINH